MWVTVYACMCVHAERLARQRLICRVQGFRIIDERLPSETELLFNCTRQGEKSCAFSTYFRQFCCGAARTSLLSELANIEVSVASRGELSVYA
jgi:hypothetical protein